MVQGEKGPGGVLHIATVANSQGSVLDRPPFTWDDLHLQKEAFGLRLQLLTENYLSEASVLQEKEYPEE